MTINFPQSPSLNEIYSYRDKIYKWNGKKWITGPVENNSLISSEFTDYFKFNLTDSSTSNLIADTNLYNFFEYDIGKDFNLWNDPTDLTKSTWIVATTILNGSIAHNNEVDPFGETTADVITEDTSTNTRYILKKDRNIYESGKTYVYSVYFKRIGSANRNLGIVLPEDIYGQYIGITFNFSTFQAYITGSGIGIATASIQDAGGGWYRVSVIATAQNSGISYNGIQYRIIKDANVANDVYSTYAGDGTSSVIIWGAKLEENIVSEYYRPRFKNKLLYSQDFGSWTTSTILVKSNVIIAPDGTSTAALLTESSQTAVFSINQPTAAEYFFNDDYTLSIYVKQYNSRYISISQRDPGSGGYIRAIFDFNTNTISSTDVGLYSVLTSSGFEIVGDGWYRIYLTGRVGSFSNGSNLNKNIEIALLSDSGVTSYAGDPNRGVYVWGAQYEKSNISDYQKITTFPEYEIDIRSNIGIDNFIVKINNKNGSTDLNYSIRWPSDVTWIDGVPPTISDKSTQIVEFYKFDSKLIAEVLYNG